jgi:hypothetical protein
LLKRNPNVWTIFFSKTLSEKSGAAIVVTQILKKVCLSVCLSVSFYIVNPLWSTKHVFRSWIRFCLLRLFLPHKCLNYNPH